MVAGLGPMLGHWGDWRQIMAANAKRSGRRGSKPPVLRLIPGRNEIVARLLRDADDEVPILIAFPIGTRHNLIPTRMGNH